MVDLLTPRSERLYFGWKDGPKHINWLNCYRLLYDRKSYDGRDEEIVLDATIFCSLTRNSTIQNLDWYYYDECWECVATAYGRRAAQLHQPDDGVAEGCNYAAEAVNDVEVVSHNTLEKLGSTCFCVLGPCMAFLGICISCLGMVFCLWSHFTWYHQDKRPNSLYKMVPWAAECKL